MTRPVGNLLAEEAGGFGRRAAEHDADGEAPAIGNGIGINHGIGKVKFCGMSVSD